MSPVCRMSTLDSKLTLLVAVDSAVTSVLALAVDAPGLGGDVLGCADGQQVIGTW